MLRKRFNRRAIASSTNYEFSKKAHRDMLLENHNKNFSNIHIDIQISDDALFELNLRIQIQKFKDSRR